MSTNGRVYVVSEPGYACGAPRVMPKGIPVLSLVGPIRAGDSVATVAKFFECSKAEVEEAIRFDDEMHGVYGKAPAIERARERVVRAAREWYLLATPCASRLDCNLADATCHSDVRALCRAVRVLERAEAKKGAKR